jgi:hypothetical protein
MQDDMDGNNCCGNSRMHSALESAQTCENGNGTTRRQHNTAPAHRRSDFGQVKTALQKRRSVDIEGLPGLFEDINFVPLHHVF